MAQPFSFAEILKTPFDRQVTFNVKLVLNFQVEEELSEEHGRLLAVTNAYFRNRPELIIKTALRSIHPEKMASVFNTRKFKTHSASVKRGHVVSNLVLTFTVETYRSMCLQKVARHITDVLDIIASGNPPQPKNSGEWVLPTVEDDSYMYGVWIMNQRLSVIRDA